MGPMTGRAAGYCAGYGMPGYMNPVRGYGFGRGGGWGRGFGGGGRGWRHRYYATGIPGWMATGHPTGGYYQQPPGYAPYGPAAPPPEHELEALREQAAFLSESLKDVQRRIDELEAETAKGAEK